VRGEHVKKALIIGIVTLLVLLSVFASFSSQNGYSRQDKSIVVSYAPFQTLALLWTADEQGFFAHNGLSVTLREYTTGAGSLSGILNGEANIAVGPAEFPLVATAFKKEGIRILGCVDKVEHIAIVARKDRGIEKPSDLKGRIVGTTIGTIAEFYLARFLELNGMSMQNITVVDLKTPEEWVNAVVNGEIDAVVTAQPYADLARNGLGVNAVVWPAQSSQPMYALIVAADEWITEEPELVNRFLKSLAQAEEYVVRNPTEVQAMLQRHLSLGASQMETLWSQNQYGLSLDQSLVTAMEDEARWMIANKLTNERQVPNFLEYISEDPLKEIVPGAVDIIR